MSEQLINEGTTLPALKSEGETLARLLKLDALLEVLASASQRTLTPSASTHLSSLLETAQSAPTLLSTRCGGGYDMILELPDREVACHSAMLRARSPLLASFLDDEEWAARRWQNGVLRVDFEHLDWRPMGFVFKFIHGGEEARMFDHTGMWIRFDSTPFFLVAEHGLCRFRQYIG